MCLCLRLSLNENKRKLINSITEVFDSVEVDRHKKRTLVGRYVMGRYDSDAYLKVEEKNGGGGIFVCESVLSKGVRFWLEKKNRKKNRSDCLDWTPCEDERQHFHLDERIHLSRYPKIA